MLLKKEIDWLKQYITDSDFTQFVSKFINIIGLDLGAGDINKAQIVIYDDKNKEDVKVLSFDRENFVNRRPAILSGYENEDCHWFNWEQTPAPLADYDKGARCYADIKRAIVKDQDAPVNKNYVHKDIMGRITRSKYHTYKTLMRGMAKAVIADAIVNLSEEDRKKPTVIFVGCPSGGDWNPKEYTRFLNNAAEELFDDAKRADNADKALTRFKNVIDENDITKDKVKIYVIYESDAAAAAEIKRNETGGKARVVIVVDAGASTLDVSVIKDGVTLAHYTRNLGGAVIEKAMYSYVLYSYVRSWMQDNREELLPSVKIIAEETEAQQKKDNVWDKIENKKVCRLAEDYGIDFVSTNPAEVLEQIVNAVSEKEGICVEFKDPSYVLYALRVAKESYFGAEGNARGTGRFEAGLTNGELCSVNVDEKIMEYVMEHTPIVVAGTVSTKNRLNDITYDSVIKAYEAVLEEMKNQIEAKLGKPEYDLLVPTGGVSIIGDVRDVMTKVFEVDVEKVASRQDSSPHTSVAKGLAYAGELEVKKALEMDSFTENEFKKVLEFDDDMTSFQNKLALGIAKDFTAWELKEADKSIEEWANDISVSTINAWYEGFSAKPLQPGKIAPIVEKVWKEEGMDAIINESVKKYFEKLFPGENLTIQFKIDSKQIFNECEKWRLPRKLLGAPVYFNKGLFGGTRANAQRYRDSRNGWYSSKIECLAEFRSNYSNTKQRLTEIYREYIRNLGFANREGRFLDVVIIETIKPMIQQQIEAHVDKVTPYLTKHM